MNFPSYYIIYNPLSRLYKFGICYNRHPKERIRKLENESGMKLSMIWWSLEEEVEDIKYLEDRVHFHFKSKRRLGEWFDISKEDVKKLINCLYGYGLEPNYIDEAYSDYLNECYDFDLIDWGREDWEKGIKPD